jgi:hypothetical protein
MPCWPNESEKVVDDTLFFDLVENAARDHMKCERRTTTRGSYKHKFIDTVRLVSISS